MNAIQKITTVFGRLPALAGFGHRLFETFRDFKPAGVTSLLPGYRGIEEKSFHSCLRSGRDL